MKKILSIILIVVVIIVLGLRFTIGYLPIFGSIKANTVISKYLGEKVSSSYNFKNSAYEVSLEGRRTVRYNLKQNTLFDTEISNTFNEQANLQYQAYAQANNKNVKLPTEIQVVSSMNADDNSKYISRLYFLGLYDFEFEGNQQASKENFVNYMVDVLEIIDENYNIVGIQASYGDVNGMLECNITPTEGNLLTRERLLVATKEILEKDWPEDYKKVFDK